MHICVNLTRKSVTCAQLRQHLYTLLDRETAHLDQKSDKLAAVLAQAKCKSMHICVNLTRKSVTFVQKHVHTNDI